MITFLQHKLWRDNVVKMIQAQGSVLVMRTLNDTEFDEQLRLKLQEECLEVKAARNKQELIEELADVMEVIDTICALHRISRKQLDEAQIAKRAEKGGFDNRIFVVKASHASDSKSVQYCRAQPDKYKEINEG